uniref:YbbD head domain-containing protein n=1 Tax=Knufia peltigerae TaxID=1002370 RepID=A0AA38XR21_9EURO|nr:hypothetical protein H2204_013576 [Knufia peltigerae]
MAPTLPPFSVRVRLLLLFALCLILTSCDLDLVMDSSYATKQEAVDAEMIAKGWIPAWVPEEATDLREVHDLDANVSALAFSRPRSKQLLLPSGCRPVDHSAVQPALFNRSWWPSEAALKRAYTFSRCEPEFDNSVLVATSGTGDHVLFWRTYAR